MSLLAATWLVRLVGAYLLVGLVFGVPFVWRGVGRIDSVAAGGTWGFRVLILPGVIALWPLMLRRWIAGAAPPEERNAHRCAARNRPEERA